MFTFKGTCAVSKWWRYGKCLCVTVYEACVQLLQSWCDTRDVTEYSESYIAQQEQSSTSFCSSANTLCQTRCPFWCCCKSAKRKRKYKCTMEKASDEQFRSCVPPCPHYIMDLYVGCLGAEHVWSGLKRAGYAHCEQLPLGTLCTHLPLQAGAWTWTVCQGPAIVMLRNP